MRSWGLILGEMRGRIGCSRKQGKTSLGIHREEAGDVSGVGGPTANIRVLCKRNGVRRRGEVEQVVVALYRRGTVAEDYAKRYFGSSMGVAAKGI